MSFNQFVKMDEDGYFVLNDGLRLENDELGLKWLRAFREQEGKVTATIDGQSVLLEYFDAPLVVQHIETLKSDLKLLGHYGFHALADLNTFCLDEWDRLHGLTQEGLPFVLSRQAQFEFFNQLDDYDDESITWKGKKIPTPPWLNPEQFDPSNHFWSDRYQNSDTPWDQAGAHPALNSVLPQLKLAKQKVLVPGCGRGHDAALFAQQGHIVTGVDFSADAVAEAKKLYGHIPNLNFAQANIFQFAEQNAGTFDLIFEHTLYCAIDPSLRNKLVQAWRKVLQPRGQVLGILFSFNQRKGPPFGGSEWEIRERLKKDFHFIYWTRWRLSSERRQGIEVVVLAQRLNQ